MSSVTSSCTDHIRPGQMSSRVDILLFLFLPSNMGTVLTSLSCPVWKCWSPKMHTLAGLQTSHPEECISYSGSDITDKLFLNSWVSQYSESNVYLQLVYMCAGHGPYWACFLSLLSNEKKLCIRIFDCERLHTLLGKIFKVIEVGTHNWTENVSSNLWFFTRQAILSFQHAYWIRRCASIEHCYIWKSSWWWTCSTASV